MCVFALPGSQLGFLDGSRGDDPQDEDVLIFAEFALISQRRRHALTLGLNPAYQHSRNGAHGSLAIRLRPGHLYGVSPGFDLEEDEDEPLLSVGHHAEDSSEVSDSESSPDRRSSASDEDSDPQRLPAPTRKRKRKRKHGQKQRGARSPAEEGGGGWGSGPGTGRRRTALKTPHSSTEKERKKEMKKSPSQQKHTFKDCCADTSKKRSKRDKKRASRKGQRADKDREDAGRRPKTFRCCIFPKSSSDKCVVKETNKGRGQQAKEEEKRSRKKKREDAQQSANQEDRREEPVTGTSRKRKRKDESKSNGQQCSGVEHPPPGPPKKKKKFQWIMNLFKGRTKAGSSQPFTEDPGPSQKRKR